MKKLAPTIAAATLLATCLPAFPSLAQDAAAPAPAAASPFIGVQTPNEYLARDQLIGAKVKDQAGTIVGDIEDLILDEESRVIGVVMGTGGFLGLAEKKIGVTLAALEFSDKDGVTTITFPGATAESLAAAPAFQRTKPKKTIMERAKEKARELTDKATTTTNQAIEKAKPKIEEAKEKALEAYEKAKEAAQPTLDKAKEAAEEAKKAVEETYEAAKEAAKEATKDLAPEATAPAPAPDAGAPAPDAAAPAPAPEAPKADQP